jgi:hypothetical protein
MFLLYIVYLFGKTIITMTPQTFIYNSFYEYHNSGNYPWSCLISNTLFWRLDPVSIFRWRQISSINWVHLSRLHLKTEAKFNLLIVMF